MTTGLTRVRPEPYVGPVAQGLIDRVQQEYVQRYGERDATPVEPGEFEPPAGLFLVARDAAGVPVGCGGWRAHRPGVAEIKRMYVVPERRRQGVAQAILAELECTAAAAGFGSLELFTGLAQPEAIAMYVAAAYTPVPGFGRYRHEAAARFYGRALPTGMLEGPVAGGGP